MTNGPPVLSPRRRQDRGCQVSAPSPDITPQQARDLADVAKALGDPTRLQIVDVIRKAAPEAVCQCELTPLFPMSQPALAKHLKVLLVAEVLESERRGTWTYYYARPGGTEELTAWLS